MKRLWVTGYRSYELNIFNEKDKKLQVIKYTLKKYYRSLLENGELDWILSGGNLGIEQWSLEVGLELAKEYPIQIGMLTPYADFSKNWNEKNQLRFEELKNKVDFYASISKKTYQNPGQLKNYQQFMFTHSDQALLIYDTEHPGKSRYDYEFIKKIQEKNDYELNLIDFYDLQEAAEEYLTR